MAVFLSAIGTAPADVVGYRVDPVKAEWSGFLRSGDTLSQSVICNFDSLSQVKLFAAPKGGSGSCHVGVWLGDHELMWSCGTQNQDENWVQFEDWNTQAAFTKGCQLEFRFSPNKADSIQIFYDQTDQYERGGLVVSRHTATPNPKDLSMQIYGRVNPVSDVWRAATNHGNDPPGAMAESALAKAETLGVAWLREDFDQMWQWEDSAWRWKAMGIYHRCENRFNLLGILGAGSDDTAKSSRGHKPCDTFWPACYPPRNLYKSVYSDSNWWARNCWSIMESMPKVKYWEVWPEANACWSLRDPDTAHYRGSSGLSNDSIDTPRERCSLYVRMCCVAESIAHVLGGERKILGGATYRLLDNDGGVNVSSGVSWLQDLFDLAEHRYGGAANCFDIVSTHPYMHYLFGSYNELYFIDDTFRINLDTSRWVLRHAGYPDMELWATEYGWPRYKQDEPDSILTDTLVQADNVCKFYTSAIARQADPGGGYDRAFHYELTGLHHVGGDNQGFGFLTADSAQDRLPHSWAFEQLEMLEGKRLNGRVILGGPRANSVRVFEFEDTTALRKRTWVCWKNGGWRPGTISTELPVRTDRLVGKSLAYSSATPEFRPKISDDGWLRLELEERPVFVTEISDPSRPDLRVDSVRYEQEERVVRAWVTNHGNRATPVRSGSCVPYPTWAVLRADGDSLSQQVRANSIAVNQQVEFTFNLGQNQLADTVLLSVTVNPSQIYVELGTDDNAGYILVAKP